MDVRLNERLIFPHFGLRLLFVTFHSFKDLLNIRMVEYSQHIQF